MLVSVFFTAILIALLGWQSYQDIRYRRLPDAGNGAVFLVGVVCRLYDWGRAVGNLSIGFNKNLPPVSWFGMGEICQQIGRLLWQEVIFGLMGGLMLSLPLLILSLLWPGSLGGGDIKLSAAGGVFLGPLRMLKAIPIIFFSAAICTAGTRKPKKASLPLGPFIGLGMVVGLFL